ncbi:MAG TPA: trypsin-like peptidase domain-containing protein [Bryobacteraceae bacterium]
MSKALAIFLLIGVTGSGARLPLADFSDAVQSLASHASSAVVQISVHGRRRLDDDSPRRAGYVAESQTKGSGVIVDSSGYIVTNAHVVEGARTIDVSVSATRQHYPATIVGLDPDTDLAVLKIPADDLPKLDFANSDAVKQGQIVVALGSPLGLENSLTVGFVSAPMRYLRPDSPMFYIQTDASINPGNSGGPLLDIEGHIAGINTMILSQSGGSEGIGLAIPSNTVRGVYEALRKDGHITRGSIGVISQDISPVMAHALGLAREKGVIVSDVAPHGSAEAAGLLPGDIVLAVNDHPVTEARQVMAVVFACHTGDQLLFDLQRGAQRVEKKVAVLDRAEAPKGLADLAARQGELVRPLGILALNLDARVNAALPGLRRLSGVAVGAIPTEYAAANPGLQAGDVIYEINGKPVESVARLNAELSARTVGQPVALLVERDGTLSWVPFEYE